MVATSPLATPVLFSPHRTHVEEPATLVQDKDLPAPVAAAAGVTAADEKSVVGYVRVHCTEDGAGPEEVSMLRSRVTVDPGFAEPDETPNPTVCAKHPIEPIRAKMRNCGTLIGMAV
jgi:hypothetical protein